MFTISLSDNFNEWKASKFEWAKAPADEPFWNLNQAIFWRLYYGLTWRPSNVKWVLAVPLSVPSCSKEKLHNPIKSCRFIFIVKVSLANFWSVRRLPFALGTRNQLYVVRIITYSEHYLREKKVFNKERETKWGWIWINMGSHKCAVEERNICHVPRFRPL
jgi:hypothetical protein